MTETDSVAGKVASMGQMAYRKLTAANFPNLFVLSYNEIAPDVEVASVGNITLSYEDTQIRSPEHAGSPATSP